MDKFIKTWKPSGPTLAADFVRDFYKWCDANALPRPKVKLEELKTHFSVDSKGFIIFT
jgi:hypothetical protein